jgi:hypothetical protein
VVQHGTQSRSSKRVARTIAAVKSGKYGKLLVSKGYCCKPRWSIGSKPLAAAPEELDFNIWLGPAPKQEYHANLVPYNWHWFWDTGNGDIGNQGVHEMDVARWAIKDATLPKQVWSLGGRFGYEDQGQTPNTQMAVYDYGDALLVFEVRGLVGEKSGLPNQVANEYYTTDGVIRDGRFYRTRAGGDGEKLEGPEVHVTPGGPFGAFLHAVRSRKPQDNNANAEVAHYSAALCHLGNISYRLGEPVSYDRASGSLGDNKQVVETFNNLAGNLKAIDLKLADTKYVLGKTLAFDAQAEQFVGAGAEAANPLLSRAYREPFVVPSSV